MIDKSKIEELKKRYNNLTDEQKQICIWLEPNKLPEKCADYKCDGFSARDECGMYKPLNEKIEANWNKDGFFQELFYSLDNRIKFLEKLNEKKDES